MLGEVDARLERALTTLRGTKHDLDLALHRQAGSRGTVLQVAHNSIVAAIAGLQVALSRPGHDQEADAAVHTDPK